MYRVIWKAKDGKVRTKDFEKMWDSARFSTSLKMLQKDGYVLWCKSVVK